MRKRKALKGGYIENQEASTGPTLNKLLYRINDDDIKNLKSTYQNNLEASEKDTQFKLAIKKQAALEYDRYKKDKLNGNVLQTKIEKNITESKKRDDANIKYVTTGFFKFIGNVINYITNFLSSVTYNIIHGGQGVFLKALFAITIIILIILGATNVIHGFNTNSSILPKFNDIGQSILLSDNQKYLVMPNSTSFLSQMSSKINDLIPNQYKYKWASISNSVTYITSGKNQYDNYLINRDEIDTGRCDNIFHINFTNGNSTLPNQKTFSIIKPKPVIVEFNENLYNDSDYNKIDNNIKELVNNYHNKCEIPISPNTNGKYVLDLIGTKYYNGDVLISNEKTKLIKNIFNNNKLNTFNNLLYSGYYDINSVIASYSTKLINPNYKGPILRLTTISNLSKQYDKNERTANFYNKYNSNYLYCIIQNKEITYTDFFKEYLNKNPNATIYVSTLYDQSGNEHHFIYEDNDNKYMPEYINDKRLIKFYTRSILYLNKSIIYNDIKLIIKMKSLKSEIAFKNQLDETKLNLDESKKYVDNFSTLKNKIDDAKNKYNELPEEQKIYWKEYMNEVEAAEIIYNKMKPDVINKYNKYNDEYNNLKYNFVEDYMDFLATRTSSVVALKGTNIDDFNLIYMDNPIQNPIKYTFEDDIDISVPFLNIEFILKTPEKSGNNITIECLGNTLDSRTNYEKNTDKNGEILGNIINKHSFRGYLSELRIFKNV